MGIQLRLSMLRKYFEGLLTSDVTNDNFDERRVSTLIVINQDR